MAPSAVNAEQVVEFWDKEASRFILVFHLDQIPEFKELWARARTLLDAAMPVFNKGLQVYLEKLSPMGRGAFLASQGPLLGLYDDDAHAEGTRAALFVELSEKLLNLVISAPPDVQTLGNLQDVLPAGTLDPTDIKALEGLLNEVLRATAAPRAPSSHGNYRNELEEVAVPLGVPGLADILLLLDMRRWGTTQVVVAAGPVEGPIVDQIQMMILKGLGIPPLDMANRRQALKRSQRALSPATYHLQRKDLIQPIGFWVLNKVYGKTLTQIAQSQNFDPEWVREQVREATRLLQAQVPTGRPRKEGVLRQWQMMLES